MFEEIKANLAERMSNHIDFRCASADEVRIAWLITEVEMLQGEVSQLEESLRNAQDD